MINIQAQMNELFSNSCYCYCLCRKFLGTDNIKTLTKYVLEAWYMGYVNIDGYVSKPLDFIRLLCGKQYRDVKHVPIRSLSELPEGEWIVEWENPKGGSHFTVENKSTISTDTALFDPAGASISRAYNKAISYRKFIK